MKPLNLPRKIPDFSALSFDIEDFFQVAAFENQCPVESWPRYECRVEANVEKLLELLEGHSTQATFFTLGWIAERYPQLVKRIVDSGHELASHGYNHQRINLLNQQQFRDDIRSSKLLLEELSGLRIDGYRAPSFSFTEQCPWITEELLEAGYLYSSSINPVPHDLYGYANAPRTPFLWPNGLLELPVTTYELLGKRIPCAGGGYFRLYPYLVFRHLMRKAIQQLQTPAIYYLHPWELDPLQPRIKGASLKSRFRHYINLSKTEQRLRQLLRDFNWVPIRQLQPVSETLYQRAD
ncbi:DUF3473 domain-containing protein [Motiliproteus coralliicola]|uniref:DUF3473 domain-containing protein n=1 Tax=Motiliproteus coralliicola TaxID=2283196 RepID=A0A369WUI9_9GAMM|nr:XrtA system polysaccharide deacetylase [Motiliproteus coralliicola]RDE24793.1 DUF3473 domain-containing protein [Motiliproteus coralliicola]